MTFIQTAAMSGVIRHEDGRIVIYRGTREPKLWFHLELSSSEKEALRAVFREEDKSET